MGIGTILKGEGINKFEKFVKQTGLGWGKRDEGQKAQCLDIRVYRDLSIVQARDTAGA